MPTLYFDLEGDELDDEDIYGDEDTQEPFFDADEDKDLDSALYEDEEEIYCKECGALVEDGFQCQICGLVVEK